MAVYKFRGKWRVEVFSDGVRVGSKTCETRGEAKTWERERLEQLKTGALSPKSKVTFEDVLKRFEAYHMPTVRASTRDRYRNNIEKRIKPHFRFMQMSRITPDMVEAFKAELGRTKLKPKTANMALETLRLILNKAKRWGLIKESPYQVDTFPVPKETYKWWEDKAHVAAFLDAAQRSRYYGAYLLALETGMRFAEIVGLNWSDLDLVEGMVRVERQWVEAEHAHGPLKNNQPRWIAFDPAGALAAELGRLREASSADAVFVTKTGRHPTKSQLSGRAYKRIQKRAKVPRITFHGLRHTFASWYMRTHDNIWALKSILGHSDIKMTQRYAHHGSKARATPLGLAALVTHKSRTSEDLETLSSEERGGKAKWGHTDLNSRTG